MDDEIRNDINNFLDDNEVKEKILKCLLYTNQTGDECAFLWTINNNKIITSDIIEGDSSGVDLKENIDRLKFFTVEKHGSFHTHSYLDWGIFPSGMDIYNDLVDNYYFSCIGMIGKENIPTCKCFPTKIIKNCIEDIKEYLKSIDEDSGFFDATKVLVGSMYHMPESWEDDIIFKEFK